MSNATFEAALNIIFKIEGFHSNDPNDPGGDTYFGISRVAHPNIPWPPTLAEATSIYQTQYWSNHNCDLLPWNWALAVFDTAVNQPSALPIAQTCVGVTADGDIGLATVAAMKKASQDQFDNFLSLRLLHYVNTPQDKPDLHGLLKRIVIISRSAAVPQAATAVPGV